MLDCSSVLVLLPSPFSFTPLPSHPWPLPSLSPVVPYLRLFPFPVRAGPGAAPALWEQRNQCLKSSSRRCCPTSLAGKSRSCFSLSHSCKSLLVLTAGASQPFKCFPSLEDLSEMLFLFKHKQCSSFNLYFIGDVLLFLVLVALAEDLTATLAAPLPHGFVCAWSPRMAGRGETRLALSGEMWDKTSRFCLFVMAVKGFREH